MLMTTLMTVALLAGAPMDDLSSRPGGELSQGPGAPMAQKLELKILALETGAFGLTFAQPGRVQLKVKSPRGVRADLVIMGGDGPVRVLTDGNGRYSFYAQGRQRYEVVVRNRSLSTSKVQISIPHACWID